jgi:aspartate oxidase
MSQRALRDVMWDRVGLVRDGEGLREALGVIDRVERELAHGIASSDSTLTTCAPPSARSCPQKGTAMNWPNSTTSIPAKGRLCVMPTSYPGP